MLTKNVKTRTINKVKRHDVDTGSTEVQVALLSRKIDELAAHLKKNRKDVHSRRGLLQMVARRQALMRYLKTASPERYTALMEELGLKVK